jgi:hypothetical protein
VWRCMMTMFPRKCKLMLASLNTCGHIWDGWPGPDVSLLHRAPLLFGVLSTTHAVCLDMM